MYVIKRDGTKVLFNDEKIYNAISKANTKIKSQNKKSLTDENISNITKKLSNRYIELNRDISVEEIQNDVENELVQTGYYDIAKEYIVYRYEHNVIREKYNTLMKDIKEKIDATNIKNQNANVDEHSFGGRMGEANDTVMKNYALENCMSEMSKNNHLNNMIYIHDLASYAVGMHNCLTIPFDKLLANGFNTRQTDVRPAQSINTAFQLMAVIFQLESLQQFGGVSASHLDHTMVPYVRKSFFKHYMTAYIVDNSDFYNLDVLNIDNDSMDNFIDKCKDEYLEKTNLTMEDFRFDNVDKLDKKYSQIALFETIKETYQAVEAMYHNLNTLQSRSGNQLPFTSINYGTCTSPEGRLITSALLNISIKGIGKLHRTSIFPCSIFQVGEGINKHKGDPNYDLFKLALKSTSKRLYPNYANIDWSGNKGYDKNDPTTYFSTMGCRTANGYDINGLKQKKDGRGNICPVTIILPTLAMIIKKQYDKTEDSEGIINAFMKLLDKKIHEAKDMLIERFEWIASQSSESAKFLYENGLMEGYIPEEGIRSALKHGTLAIGQIGLAETLQLLIGTNQTTSKGMSLAKDIEKLFKDRCEEFKNEYKLNFGVYYTPAENLCYTSMEKFKNKYGVIEHVSDKDYFTNSMHVPVWEKVNAFEKIDIESQLTSYSSAGCITYVELDSTCKNNISALETLVVYAMDKDIPYFAINVPNDMCTNCGYTDEINNKCPECDSTNIRRLRRVTGYLTGDYKTAFNPGKQKEVEDRVKHI